MRSLKATIDNNIDINHERVGELNLIRMWSAGFFIGIGAAAAQIATGMGNKVLAATVFPIGLILTIIFNSTLFTGSLLSINNIIRGKTKGINIIGFLLLTYFFNFCGAVGAADIIYFSGALTKGNGIAGAYAIDTMISKLSLSYSEMFFSGVMCNIFVCAAILMAASSFSTCGKIAATALPIFIFVFCGFEHCVANMYYIQSASRCMLNPRCLQTAFEIFGYTEDYIKETITVKNVFAMLGMVTLGNIVGGIFFAVLSLVLSNKPKEEKIDVV